MAHCDDLRLSHVEVVTRVDGWDQSKRTNKSSGTVTDLSFILVMDKQSYEMISP